MDNEAIEKNNKSIQDTFENPPKISIYKINILASVENTNINENINGNINENIKENEGIIKDVKTKGSKKNLLYLDNFSNKRKSKKSNIKNILESSFRSKKRSSLPDQGNNDNLKDNKSNKIVINNNGNNNSNKDSEFYSHIFISPRAKNQLNRENNESELKLSKLAEQLYKNEEHFQKKIISKKYGLNDSLNTIKKNDSFISEEIIKKKRKNNAFLKLESLDKDNSNSNLLKLFIENKDYKRRKSNVSSSSKGVSSNYNTKKDKKKNYSNFKKIKIKNEIDKKGDGEEDKNKIKKIPKLSNDRINNSKTLKKNLSSKALRIFGSKKTLNENNDIKSKNTKKKSPNKINNNKSQINDDKKNEKNKTKKKDNKSQKFRFFCCLNNKEDDSDENCN